MSELVIFTADMPATPGAPANQEGMLDAYAPGGTVGLHNEPDEMDEDERADMTYRQRLFDAPGEDTAYTTGLSQKYLPAPQGGWPADTRREELEV